MLSRRAVKEPQLYNNTATLKIVLHRAGTCLEKVQGVINALLVKEGTSMLSEHEADQEGPGLITLKNGVT